MVFCYSNPSKLIEEHLLFSSFGNYGQSCYEHLCQGFLYGRFQLTKVNMKEIDFKIMW